jgi:hypothetical protein
MAFMSMIAAVDTERFMGFVGGKGCPEREGQLAAFLMVAVNDGLEVVLNFSMI